MKKTKKLIMFLAVGLMLLTPVFGLIPPTEGRASAATPKADTWWADAPVQDRVKMYLYIMAMTGCLNNTEDKGVSADKVSNYEFFGEAFGLDFTTWGGHLLSSISGESSNDPSEGGDGKLSCSGSEARAWIEDFVSFLGSTGIVSQKTGLTEGDGDPFTTACYLGWDRKDRAQSQPADECVDDGDREFKVPENHKGFRERLTKDLAGVSTSAPHGLLNAADLYYLYSQTVMVACVTNAGERIGYLDETDGTHKSRAQDGQNDGDSNYYILDSITDDFQVRPYILKGTKDRNNNKIISNKSNVEKWNPDCSEIEKLANKQAKAAAAFLQANPEQADKVANLGEGAGGDPANSGLETTGSGPEDTTCGGFEGIFDNPLNWLACAALGSMKEAASQLDGFVMGMLCVSENDIFGDQDTCTGANSGDGGTSENFHEAWNVFRLLALAMLAIGGLVMILSQGLGFELFDAYTIKKVLPRLLIAGIGISLSWELLSFLVSFSNGLGIGIRGLIYAPFEGGTQEFVQVLQGGEAAMTALFAAGAFVGLGALGLLSFVGTAFLAILIAFFVLIIRNILVILLILVAPLAIAAYILPNTEKYYKTWWEWLFKALMVFPIITAMIAVGHVFAAITVEKGGTFTSFVAVAAYFAPYFLIPAAFRFAGGALATIGGFANDRSRGGFDRLKKFRAGQSARNWENIKAGKRWQGNPVGERLSRSLQTASLIGDAGYNPARMRDRVRSARSTRISAMSAEAEKDPNVRSVLGNDDLLSAALHGNRDDGSARAYLHGLGQRGAALEQNVASVRGARRAMGRDAFEDFAAANLAGTGTGYAAGPSEMFETINRVAGNDRARATRILNQARGQAERAKRVDLYGAGFGTSADQLELMHTHQPQGQAQRAAYNAAVDEVMTDEALDAKGAYEVGSARNGGLVNMVGAIQRRTARAEAGVIQARAAGGGAPTQQQQLVIDAAEHEYKRALAATAGLHDIASNTSPENAQLTGAIMGQAANLPLQGVTNRTGTMVGMIDGLRGDAEFQQYRKEYGQSATTAAAAAAAQAAAGQAPGGAQPGGPGGPGAPGGPALGGSDRRIKEDITYLQKHDNGIKLYSFRYVGDSQTYVGVMAQDILTTHPQAISFDEYGFYRVDYSMLGLEMETLEQWLDKSALTREKILTF